MMPASVRHTFVQDEDSCGRTDAICQELHVETCDGGGGSYLVLATERWAIDDVDKFARTLKAVQGQVEAAEK